MRSGFAYTDDAFWSRVERGDGCWLWTGPVERNGYGKAGRRGLAHRVAYELIRGPIQRGMEIDHLCRHRGCVNPSRMEIVTRGENNRRAAALITHCPKGHPYDETNTYRRQRAGGGVDRHCRTCWRDRRDGRE